MIIDGVDLKTKGLEVFRRGDSRSSPTFGDNFVQVPGMSSALWLGSAGVAQKPITLVGYIVATTLAQLRSRVDEIKWRLRPGAHTLRWSDDATREWLVRTEQVLVRGFDPEWVRTSVNIEITLWAEDPRGRNPTEQNVNSAGALPRVLTPAAIGNAPMPVILTITGNNGSPIPSITVEYRDSADAIIATFAWDGDDLTGSDTLVIDTGRAVVERNSTNDSANVTDSSGALPFDMDPARGDFVTQALPDIRIAGTGTADVCRLTYRERWW